MVEATDHGSPAQQTTATVIIFSNEAFCLSVCLSVCLIDIRMKLDCGLVFWKKGCLEVCIMHFIIVNLLINSTSTTNMADDITTTATITERFVA